MFLADTEEEDLEEGEETGPTTREGPVRAEPRSGQRRAGLVAMRPHAAYEAAAGKE
jgi:hypothetical protein